MTRRRTGALALLLVAVLLLTIRFAERPGVPGIPAAAPLPGPPPVGSCLITDGPEDDSGSAPVDCATPHDLEVTAGVTADATPPNRSQCDARAAEYLAPITVDGWLVPVDLETTVLLAPPGQRAGDRGWQACTIRPESGQRFTGSVRGMTLATFRRDVFGTCLDVDPRTHVSCRSPHGTELLGTGDFVYPEVAAAGAYFGVDNSAITLPDVVQADLDRRCTTLAAVLTATADPTYGAQLTIRTIVRTVVPTDVPGSFLVYVSCLAGAPADRPLTGSVIGNGGGPLPFG